MSAQDFLSERFDDGVGHNLLAEEAAVMLEEFTGVFDFTFAEIQRAKSQGENKNKQVESLLSLWYSRGPTVEDLRAALGRWKHKKLLRQLGLDAGPIAPTPRTTFAAPAPKRRPELDGLEKRLSDFNCQLMTLAMEASSLSADIKAALKRRREEDE